MTSTVTPHPLALWRKETGITQTQLALMLDITEGSIRRLEQGTLNLTGDYASVIPIEVINKALVWVNQQRTAFAAEYPYLLPGEQDPNQHPFYNFRATHELSINSVAKSLCIPPRMITDHEFSITQVIPDTMQSIFTQIYGVSETLAYTRAVERFQSQFGDSDD